MTAALCVVTSKLLEGEIYSLVVFLTRNNGGTEIGLMQLIVRDKNVQLDEMIQEAIDNT